MAGLYKRTVVPNFATPAMQAQASQGAGGAIPRGGVVAPKEQEPQDNSKQIEQIGGLLSMLGPGTPVDKSGFGLSSGVPEINTQAATPGADVLGGLALANNGMSYESAPTGLLASLGMGWNSVKNLFGGFGGFGGTGF